MNKHYVFVYGTLLSDLPNNYLLKTSKLIGEAKTVEKFKLQHDWIPFLNTEKKEQYIKGEVYEVSDNVLESLDRLEGYSDDRPKNLNMYNREIIEVKCDNQTLECFVYTNNNFGKENVPNGDYKKLYLNKLKYQ
jgi:gamma-glutamylcyclotransferase (GGCT)/AIG2-like uncharacterized protein YtfP